MKSVKVGVSRASVSESLLLEGCQGWRGLIRLTNTISSLLDHLFPLMVGTLLYQLTLPFVLKSATSPDKFDFKIDNCQVNFTFHWDPGKPHLAPGERNQEAQRPIFIGSQMLPKSHLMQRHFKKHNIAGGEGFVLFGGEINSKKKRHGQCGEFQI